jgi:hypothetical protein
MVLQVLMALIVVFLHGHLLSRTVHALHLAIGPEMIDLGEPVLDAMLKAYAVEDMMEGVLIPLALRKLNSVVG